MSTMASQITGVSIVCTAVYSGVDQRKHQSSVSLAFVRGIHRSPVNSPHKGSVTRKMLPFDGMIMDKRGVLLDRYIYITTLFCSILYLMEVRHDMVEKSRI